MWEKGYAISPVKRIASKKHTNLNCRCATVRLGEGSGYLLKEPLCIVLARTCMGKVGTCYGCCWQYMRHSKQKWFARNQLNDKVTSACGEPEGSKDDVSGFLIRLERLGQCASCTLSLCCTVCALHPSHYTTAPAKLWRTVNFTIHVTQEIYCEFLYLYLLCPGSSHRSEPELYIINSSRVVQCM